MTLGARQLPLLVLLAVLCGCGVPNDATPRALPADEIPIVLGSQAPPEQSGLSEVQLFFQREDAVAAVQRSVKSPPSDREAVQLLFDGPTPPEKDAGFSSQMGDVELDGVRKDGDVAVVSLAGPAEKLTKNAYAQIVATLAPSRAPGGVRFRLDGRDLKVPDGDGALSSNPRTRADYTDVLDLAPSASPTPDRP